MAFWKQCVCKRVFVCERILDFPDYCPDCGRRLLDQMAHGGEPPKGTTETPSAPPPSKEGGPAPAPGSVQRRVRFALRLDNGAQISIPAEGCVIGRTETGAEELAEYVSVSRKHLRVSPARHGVMLEDLSTYGTYLDGMRLEKESPVHAVTGMRITLCNVETELISQQEENV